MKGIKKILALALILALCAALAVPAMAGSYETQAEELKALGVFKGTDAGLELDRAATRAEAAVMLVRLLGAEQEAADKLASGEITQPFTDVPDWASSYIAWLYAEGLTKGVGDSKFDVSSPCDAKMYCTFMLRSLGYSEDAEDFTYDSALDKATELGIYSTLTMPGEFQRDELVAVSYQTLSTSVKDGEQSLLEKLIGSGAVDADSASAITGKQALMNEFIAACGAVEEMTAIELAVDAAMDMSLMGMTMPTTITMNAKAIMGDSIQLEMLAEAASEGETMAYSIWMRDGWLYMNDGVESYKVELNIEEAMSILEASEAEELSAAYFPMYFIDSIEKQGENTYVITFSGFLNDVMQSAMAQSGAVEGMDADIELGGASCSITFGDDGQLKNMTVTLDMTINMTAEDTEFAMGISFDVNCDIVATGSDVTITYPDFSAYAEMSLGEAL